MIPWASPLAQFQTHESEIRTAMTRVLQSGAYVLGEEVSKFERAFANYLGTSEAVGVGNGTDALTLALRALGAGEGDEVITVSHTALATGAAILATGATPVLVDIDAVYYTMDAALLERAISPRTKAIVVVHLYGQAADMDAILAIAKRHDVPVVEDCAQAAGASYRGRRLGSLGTIASFSFYPTKNLGAIGDGGMVATSDATLAARLRELRQYGWDEQRQTREIGFNSRLDPLQAAILGAKLPKLDADNRCRNTIAARYDAGLAGLPLTVPARRPDAEHAYHLYVIACDNRDALKAHLASEQVGSAIHYAEPVHRHGGYDKRVVIAAGGLPVTEKLVGRILSLPIYPELSDSDVDRVIAAVRGHFGARRT